VRANVVASQVNLHREWGGVVPELSARQHIRDICGVVERALRDADLPSYDAIAVTQGPGLVGSLLVGLSFAKALASARGAAGAPSGRPIESLVLAGGEMPPAVVLVVSGGTPALPHPSPGVFELLGPRATTRPAKPTTKDPGLYPGGPVTGSGCAAGGPRGRLPRARMTHADRNAAPARPSDFSFSGLVGAAPRATTP
jgi:N6-L-threonylcarbamoyladenine synthase